MSAPIHRALFRVARWVPRATDKVPNVVQQKRFTVPA